MRVELQSSAVVYNDDGTVSGHCVTWDEFESSLEPVLFGVQLSKTLQKLSDQTYEKVVDINFK